MRDIHCHILPGVDDGSRDLDESLQMLEAAKNAGVTNIVCTPHCRSPWFDYDKMWDAYELLVAHADGFPIQMGFEVNYMKLMDLGLKWADYLHFEGSHEFLLELVDGASAEEYDNYERLIFDLQGMGYDIIIAHPERYKAIQNDIELANRLVRMGCRLQASGNCFCGGFTSKRKKTAKKLFDAGLYSYVASDAHCVGDYETFKKAVAFVKK